MLFFVPISSKASESQTITIYSEPSDGISKFLGSSGVHSWLDVRNNETGNQCVDNQSRYYKGILAAFNPKNDGVFVVSRSFFVFDTSNFDDNVTISRAFLYLYGVGANESRVCVVSWMDGEDGLDYDDFGFTGATSFGISRPWKIDQYNAIELNEHGKDAINTKGYTYLCCREYDHDFLNVSPPVDMLSEFRNGHVFADEPGTEMDPHLLIIYEQTNAEGNGSNSNQTINTNDQHQTPFISVSIFFILIILIIISDQMNKKNKS